MHVPTQPHLPRQALSHPTHTLPPRSTTSVSHPMAAPSSRDRPVPRRRCDPGSQRASPRSGAGPGGAHRRAHGRRGRGHYRRRPRDPLDPVQRPARRRHGGLRGHRLARSDRAGEGHSAHSLNDERSDRGRPGRQRATRTGPRGGRGATCRTGSACGCGRRGPAPGDERIRRVQRVRRIPWTCRSRRIPQLC